MKKIFAIATAIVLLCLGVVAQAVTIETVAVGDAGNAADTAAHSCNYPAGQGAVAYNYNIGKYEVTAWQYTEFLNAKATTDTYGLYSTSMTGFQGCNIVRSGSSGSFSYSVAADWANRPVNYVSYWDSCRFANWLSNGQGNGDTETGAYTLTPAGIADNTIVRNAGAKWAVTSEDEWYKAAYYKGGSINAGYWFYPTQSNTTPANQVLPTDPGNSANYNINCHSAIDSPYYRTNVGEFENSASAYGTFDQAGNVWEWNEAIIITSYRGLRGGSYTDLGVSHLQSSTRYNWKPDCEEGWIGFRVSQVITSR